ncbi:MAG TPA: mandelate racemase/muconate lactonizing enzyme family protein [Acidimicrobiia bacterium]|nr:mandelate racemase/muconate lactonizing enzyme family protein [Acidimicrobiia bacterium]
MRIASLEARSYRYPLDPPFLAAWDPNPRRFFNETIVIVATEEGVSGYCGGASLPDVDLLATLLVGASAEETDRVLALCEAVDFHGGRNWTVEVAIWDALARAAGMPLWQFLGGKGDRYRVYQSTGELVGPDQRVERLMAARDLGVSAAKIRLGPEWQNDMKVVEAARAALGGEFALMVDANQGWRMPADLAPRWDLPTAQQCSSICDDLDVYWLEEPLDPSQLEAYAELRSTSSTRIAAGEMVRSLDASRRLTDVVDVIQTDVVLAGGVGGCRRVAGWAVEKGIQWSPHTWTTGFGLIANLHVALAFSKAPYLEYPFDPPAWTVERRDFMLPQPLSLDGEGNVVAPDGPGLGVVPDFDFLDKWRVG